MRPGELIAAASVVAALAAPDSAACKKGPEETQMQDKGAARSFRIEETTVRAIDGWKVTVANIMKGKWRLPDGREREGLTAVVGLYDEKKADKGERTVGEGAALEIAGRRWIVVKVEAGKGADNGVVEIREER